MLIPGTSCSRRGVAAGGVLTAALALALALPAAAQTAAYRRAPGDTLRYDELNESKSETKGPGPDGRGASSASESRRESTVALTFTGSDTAQAWFEAFSSTTKAQGRETSVSAEALVNRPFLLRFGANGAVQVLSGPTAPGFDGRALFGQFFLRLPDRPLAAGTEWADTIAGKQDNPDGSKFESQLIVRYRVVGDTALAGGKAVVIASKAEGTSKTTANTGAGSMETRTRTSGTGRVVFSTELGRMLSLEMTVDRTGRTMARSGTGDDQGAIGAIGRPRGRVDMGGAEARATELRSRTHTLIELVAGGGVKAAPPEK